MEKDIRILIIEDEPSMRLGLSDNLQFEGYSVEEAVDGEAGLDCLLKNEYDLALLDVMMPRKSGFEVCKEARKEGITTPIILLTARGEELDKVRGLEWGADDYITKPFGLGELMARIKAVLRRTQGPSSSQQQSVFSIGKLKVDFNNFVAESDTEGVLKLSHREFEILQYLYTHRNKVVSRDELLEKVWGYDNTPTTRTVDNFIARLRQKIEPNPDSPTVILTVHGIGYKML
ncbi:MAG: response regulator transcription factor [Bacteroidia bacterium]